MYEVIEYLQRNLHMRLICSEVAKKFGYSTANFCVLFRQYTGMSFVTYLRHFRMRRALSDLLSGESVTETAYRYGYDTVGGFEKAFMNEFGDCPREILRANQSKYLEYQKKRETMNQLSDRCAMLRDSAMNRSDHNQIIEPQHSIWFDVSRHEMSVQSPAELAFARTISLLCDNIPVIIREGELIVGDNYGRSYPNVDICDDSQLSSAGLSEAQLGYVHKSLLRPFVQPVLTYAYYSQEEKRLEEEWAGIGRGVDGKYSVLNYEKVLRLGFEGILTEVRRLREKHPESHFLYEAAEEICLAGCRIGQRYAEEAERQAKSPELTENRRAELEKIALVCRRVPRLPARDLQEAIQSLLFAHYMNTWEDAVNANSLGRLDQIFYPYYEKEVNEGTMDEKKAFELICCLWIKLYRDYDVQQSCIGGCRADGSDAVNPLSFLMLDATEQLDFVRCLSVRFSPRTDKAFLRRALEVVSHVGKGVPFFFNDDVMIPALVNAGISPEDARDYTQLGCVETVIPGKSNPNPQTGEVNLLKGLEYALNNGFSMISPDFRCGTGTGDPLGFDTYDKLWDAVREQISYIFDRTCSKIVKLIEMSAVNSPRPYKSLLTEGCLESGRDYNNHGAKYDYYEFMICGIPNLADSLIVLRKFVYEEKKYTLAEVIEALKNDYPDETMRQEFLTKAPKYGNDIDEVDMIATELTNFACDLLDTMSEKYGLRFFAQPFSYLWMVDHGRWTAATPDGRRKGEVIACGVSPMQGRDFSGVSALMNSICKLPTKRTPGTTSAVVEVDPKLFSDYNLDRFVDLLVNSAEKGLSNIQFNTVSLDILRDAKIHPESHRNLAVSVSGFSQKFNLLSPELQNHIMERTKHQNF